MKKEFLPSGILSTTKTRTRKLLLSLALVLLISFSSFAHRAEPFTFGCITPGQNMQIDAVVVFAGGNTHYQWQFMDNSGNWRCFTNGTLATTINGVKFTVSGATAANVANNAPLLTINTVTTALEGVLVRVLMRDFAYPVCATTQIGHTLTGDTYGGDDQGKDETKHLRLHVFGSTTICPPNAYSCTGNVLSNAQGFYGGFENKTYSEANDAYTSTNFGTGIAASDYTVGTGNGTYMDINNPYAKSDAFQRNVAPHTGNFQLVVEGSTTVNSRAWYKTGATVTPGTQYRFAVWAARVNTTDPIINLRVTAGTTTTTLVTYDMSTVTPGVWQLIQGNYTAPSGVTSIALSITDSRLGGNNDYCLDDICFRVCTNCSPTLPLHQLDLKASLQGNNVNVKWIAENEMNTSNFIIERSLDGISYDAIGNTAPTGALNTPTEYLHNDNIQNLGANVIYYRIKAMDNDGRSAYSNIATVRLSKTAGVQVWPNPFGSFVNITYNSSSNTKVDVSIVNSLGNVVKQNSYTVSRGLNQISFGGLETLSAGMYFVRITDKSTNEVYIQKISK